MNDPNTSLMNMSYALAVGGAVGNAAGFTIAAARRSAPSWSDRALFYVVCAALTVHGIGSSFAAHEYARAALCALALALVAAAYGACTTRADAARTAEARASAAARAARRTRRPRPYH